VIRVFCSAGSKSRCMIDLHDGIDLHKYAD
jgi:hypothetical protein